MTDNFLNINNNIKSSKIKNVFTGIFAYIIALIILAFFMMQSVRNVLANDININYISQNEEIFEIANELYDEGNYKLCLEFLLQHQDKSPYIAHYIGGLYIEKKALNNPKEAIYWWKVAANKGVPASLFNLGLAHEFGDFVEQDYDLAITYHEMAYKKKYEESGYRLAKIYKDYKNDYKTSFYYLSEVVLGNNKEIKRDAFADLAFLYLNGYYVNVDVKKAVYYMEQAGNLGHYHSMYYAGKAFIFGIKDQNINQDYEKGLYYITLAAENGEVDAMMYFVSIFKDNVTSDKEQNIILNYIFKAASKDNGLAHMYAARVYLDGYGNILPDTKKVLKHIKKAANLNVPEAQYILAAFYSEGIQGMLEQNTKLSDHWLNLSAKNGYEKALDLINNQ